MSFISLPTPFIVTEKEGGEILLGVWPVFSESAAICNCMMIAVSFRMRATLCSQIVTISLSSLHLYFQ